MNLVYEIKSLTPRNVTRRHEVEGFENAQREAADLRRDGHINVRIVLKVEEQTVDETRHSQKAPVLA